MSKTEPKPGKRPLGRPSTYTPDLAATILERIGEGELVTEICGEPGMPARGTLFRWELAHPEFRDAYMRARVRQAQAVAERAILDAKGATAENHAAQRLKYDAQRWLSGKLDPKRYGDKMQVDTRVIRSVEDLSDDEIDALLARRAASQQSEDE